MIRNFFIYLAVLVVGILFFASMVLFAIPAFQESTVVLTGLSSNSSESDVSGSDKESIEADVAKLQKKLDSFTPTNAYMIVNTSDNHFYLYKGKQLVRDGICSTGKNEKLVSEDRKYEHIFHTPYGVRKVIRKATNPVWTKPDWAFIEEGLPVPSPRDPSRIETGTLGAYKLEIGDGFMIHGTIYKRRMGMSVTHGCVRLLDDDLEAVYKTMEIGSKVYIF
jgi:lipoprotein-anchoring transpeptidase ErfK/SrfK